MFNTPESIAEAFGLKRSGAEYKGPCPICGGTDRFHVKNGTDKLLLHCRNGCLFSDLASAVDIGRDSRPVPRRSEITLPKIDLGPFPPSQTAWSLTNAAQPNHPYLIKKRIQPHGIGVVGPQFEYAPRKVKGRGNLLAIPAYRAGHIVAIQYVGEDGTRAWQAGCKTAGATFAFQGGRNVWIVEGFATGASLHEDTRDTVVVAFSAGQVPAAVKWAQRAFRGRPVRVMADDDKAGHKAARAAGVDWRVPFFSGLNRAAGDNDYNDYVRLRDG